VKIYTKTGDDGSTGLLASGRVRKDCPRIEAYGTVDELNAALGVARAAHLDATSDAFIARIQEELFVVGSALADPNPDGPFHHAVHSTHIDQLEDDIDALESTLPALTRFILPGGSTGAAHLHLARTISRRAERRVVALADTPGESVPEAIVVYLNRLSDLLFVLARYANLQAGVSDIPWSGL
jgi:cob(I)alamin adenosyltransferase